MNIHTEILGNCRDAQWAERLRDARIDTLELDQWTAQKSRFIARTEQGESCAVALRRHAQLLDGDILAFDPEQRRALVVRLRLHDVLVADLGALVPLDPAEAIRTALEFGHAVGNQHWPAVVRGTKVYIPLTVDRRVMQSVLNTHRIERIEYAFRPGSEVIPYLAPHEIRRLFGGAGPDGHGHEHGHEHEHGGRHEHGDGHEHGDRHEHGGRPQEEEHDRGAACGAGGRPHGPQTGRP